MANTLGFLTSAKPDTLLLPLDFCVFSNKNKTQTGRYLFSVKALFEKEDSSKTNKQTNKQSFKERAGPLALAHNNMYIVSLISLMQFNIYHDQLWSITLF